MPLFIPAPRELAREASAAMRGFFYMLERLARLIPKKFRHEETSGVLPEHWRRLLSPARYVLDFALVVARRATTTKAARSAIAPAHQLTMNIATIPMTLL
jgi:hypothetical protein